MACSIGPACIGCTACARACPVGAITGERGSLHRIDPRLCIECEACGRVCPKTAVAREDGSPVARLMPRSAWPKPVFDLSRCVSCASCADRCPTACLDMGPGKPGGLESWPALARPEACVSCGWCVWYCPAGCIEITAPAAARGGAPEGAGESAAEGVKA